MLVNQQTREEETHSSRFGSHVGIIDLLRTTRSSGSSRCNRLRLLTRRSNIHSRIDDIGSNLLLWHHLLPWNLAHLWCPLVPLSSSSWLSHLLSLTTSWPPWTNHVRLHRSWILTCKSWPHPWLRVRQKYWCLTCEEENTISSFWIKLRRKAAFQTENQEPVKS